MGRLGCSWAELGERTTDCVKQLAVPIASSRPRRNRPTFIIAKTLSRLVSSWAEMTVGIADCPGQSTLSGSHQSAQAQSAHLTLRGKLTRSHSERQVQVINARSRDIGVAGRPSHIQDLAEMRCRPLRRFRGQDDKTAPPSPTVRHHALRAYSMGSRSSGPDHPERVSRWGPAG